MAQRTEEDPYGAVDMCGGGLGTGGPGPGVRGGAPFIAIPGVNGFGLAIRCGGAYMGTCGLWGMRMGIVRHEATAVTSLHGLHTRRARLCY
jgi:hypothetical protein